MEMPCIATMEGGVRWSRVRDVGGSVESVWINVGFDEGR